MKKFIILIPVYNDWKSVFKLLENIDAQTEKWDAEVFVLVVNDASTEERLELMIKTGRRFNKIALPSLVILIATGIYNSHLVLQSPEILFSSSYGAFLITKIILVIALIVTFSVHIRVFSKDVEKKITQRQITDNELQKLNRKGMILGEATVVISVAILFFAALLDAGI